MVDQERLDDEDYSEEDDRDDQTLAYHNRLREFVKDVGDSDGFDIGFTLEGTKRLQDALRYFTAMLTYEIIEVLKKKKKKQIKPVYVDEALTNFIGRTDTLGLVTGELSLLINKLETLNRTTPITKAFNFVNDIPVDQED